MRCPYRNDCKVNWHGRTCQYERLGEPRLCFSYRRLLDDIAGTDRDEAGARQDSPETRVA